MCGVEPDGNRQRGKREISFAPLRRAARRRAIDIETGSIEPDDVKLTLEQRQRRPFKPRLAQRQPDALAVGHFQTTQSEAARPFTLNVADGAMCLPCIYLDPIGSGTGT